MNKRKNESIKNVRKKELKFLLYSLTPILTFNSLFILCLYYTIISKNGFINMIVPTFITGILSFLLDWSIKDSFLIFINPLRNNIFKKYGSPQEIDNIIENINNSIEYEYHNLIISKQYISDKKDYSKIINCDDVLGIHKIIYKKRKKIIKFKIVITDKWGQESFYEFKKSNEKECDDFIAIICKKCPNAMFGYTNQQKQYILTNKIDLNKIDYSINNLNTGVVPIIQNNNITNSEDNSNTKKLKLICIILFVLLILMLFLVGYMIFSNTEANVNKLKESVVQIYSYDKYDDLITTGSGVIAFKNDIVLTNAHVVEDNYRMEIISEHNKRYNVIGILGYNKSKDVAILKIKKDNDFKPLRIKTNKLSINNKVIAIGSPLGIKNTVSDGIISGILEDYIDIYQHTAPISAGSSGGALLDKKGNLLGITYASFEEGQNLNLAIPIKYFKNEYEKVKDCKLLKTKNYKYLNNKILKNDIGRKIIKYVLNDRYDNIIIDKSKIYYPSDYTDGEIVFCNGLSNCRTYISENDFDDIKDKIDSSVYIESGISTIMQFDFTMTNTDYRLKKIRQGEYYNIVILKLKENSNINKIKKFLANYEDRNKEFPKFYYSKNNKKYLYRLACVGYNKCEEIKKILDELDRK